MSSGLFLLRKSSLFHKQFAAPAALSALSHLFSAPFPASAPSSPSFSINQKWDSRNAFLARQDHNFTTKTHATHGPPAAMAWHGWGMTRGFHSGRPSESAGYAVADFSDDDKKGNPPGAAAVADDGLDISKLGISNEIVTSLARKGITKLFPIQRAVLEPAMKGRDMIGRAKTGTGKTLAFGIPILDKIIKFNETHGRIRNPLALVLAPTRELARQVDKEFYESAPSLDTLCVYGGSPIARQMSALDRGVDVVVGTPGRVIDLMKRGTLNLSDINFVVLDEADLMLSVGFAEDMETILDNIRQEHQTMMFSATMPSFILNISRKHLKNPVHIDLVGDNDQKLAEGISLYSITSEMHQKAAVIGPLITEHAKGGKCIVFTQTKRGADRLAYAMQKKFRCEALHGDISQNQRERTLAGFRDGRFNVLVATDVAARGLDVPNVDLVVHYELPNSSEIFVHRSGRTGRAGKKGAAILMYSSSQYRDVKSIERDIGCRFTELPRIAVEGGSMDMFDDFGQRGRFDSFGDGRGPGGGRYGGHGNSMGRFNGYGPRSSFGQHGQSDGFGGPGYGESRGRGGFGSQRGSERDGGFGNLRGSDGADGFGSRGRPSSIFEGLGSGRFGGFRNTKSSQHSRTSSSRFGFSKEGRSDGNQNPGRNRKLF